MNSNIEEEQKFSRESFLEDIGYFIEEDGIEFEKEEDFDEENDYPDSIPEFLKDEDLIRTKFVQASDWFVGYYELKRVDNKGNPVIEHSLFYAIGESFYSWIEINEKFQSNHEELGKNTVEFLIGLQKAYETTRDIEKFQESWNSEVDKI
jgi:hypothetical protein